MSPQRLDVPAPDGSPVEVVRNHGKPTAAQEAALRLAQERLRQLGSSKPAPPRRTRGQARAEAGQAAPPAHPQIPQVPPPESVDRAEAAALRPKDQEATRRDERQMSQIPPNGASASSGVESSVTAPDQAPSPTADPASPRAGPAKAAKARREPAAPAAPPSPPPAGESGSSMPSVDQSAGPAPDATPPKRRNMQVRFTGMKPMHVVEAALFSAGKPVGVDEIAATTGLPPESVKAGLKELVAAYESRDSVLEVGKAGAKWAMQVKTQAAEPAAKFAPMEIPPKVLKTLALIAYHQPMKQSELVEMMGTKVYDHVPELVQRGLVRAREEGSTKVLVTTSAFPEYFGLDAEKPEEIRAVMAKLVGLEARPKEAAPTVTYEEPQQHAPEPTGAGADAGEPAPPG